VKLQTNADLAGIGLEIGSSRVVLRFSLLMELRDAREKSQALTFHSKACERDALSLSFALAFSFRNSRKMEGNFSTLML
jgi:hypothetical protein